MSNKPHTAIVHFGRVKACSIRWSHIADKVKWLHHMLISTYITLQGWGNTTAWITNDCRAAVRLSQRSEVEGSCWKLSITIDDPGIKCNALRLYLHSSELHAVPMVCSWDAESSHSQTWTSNQCPSVPAARFGVASKPPCWSCIISSQ